MGLSEPLVQREGARRIIIELPGVKDPDEAIKRIGKTAVLEFKNDQGQTVMLVMIKRCERRVRSK